MRRGRRRLPVTRGSYRRPSLAGWRRREDHEEVLGGGHTRAESQSESELDEDKDSSSIRARARRTKQVCGAANAGIIDPGAIYIHTTRSLSDLTDPSGVGNKLPVG